MRMGLIGAFVCLAWGAAADRAVAAAWRPDVREARAWAAERPGTFSLSVRTACGVWGVGQDRAAPGASLLKPLLMVAHLRRRDVRRRALTDAERALLGPMIRRSANEPANALVVALGARRIERTAQRVGMPTLRLLDPWGLSPVTAREQARFWLRLDRAVPRRHRPYARSLLRRVVPSQRWGLGRAVPRGWQLHLKGGWGSGTGLVDHQSALLVRGDERVALSVLTRDNGTHAAGKRTLRGVGRRLLAGLARRSSVCD